MSVNIIPLEFAISYTVSSDLVGFRRPPTEREVFRSAFASVLSNYAEDHPALPFDTDDPDLDTLADHRTDFGGNYSQFVSRLNSRLQDTSFEIHSETHLDLDDLLDILSTSSASYPLVELDVGYYEETSDYQIQKGQFGFGVPALITPLIIEEEVVFYYDPLLDYYENVNKNARGRSMGRGIFTELWGRTDLTKWACWVDQGKQQTFADIKERES